MPLEQPASISRGEPHLVATANPYRGLPVPDLSRLKTGDLLFPRMPTSRLDERRNSWLYRKLINEPLRALSSEHTARPAINAVFQENMTLRELLSQAGGAWKVALDAGSFDEVRFQRLLRDFSPEPLWSEQAPDFVMSATPPVATPTLVLPNGDGRLIVPSLGRLGPQHLRWAWGHLSDATLAGLPAEAPDWTFYLRNPAVALAMLKMLVALLGRFSKEWLDTTLVSFFTGPAMRFLYRALTSPDVREGIFIGHVAMVLREQDGASVEPPLGNVYVVEANCTDFSHFRVALHPYWIEPAASKERLGWANVRASQGDRVWHARPMLDGNEWKTRLIEASLQLLGRPYGFFDHPEFGDDNRLYCSEFVYRAFKDVDASFAKRLQQYQTWGGMLAYLKASGQAEQRQVLAEVRASARGIDLTDRFFVLPPALLWNSSGLLRDASLQPEVEPYAPPF